MSQAMGKSSGSSAGGAAAGSSASSQALAGIATQFAAETKPVRNELVQNYMDILQTGGSEAVNPIIAKAVEASRAAASKSTNELHDRLARLGLVGTPYGESILAGQTQQGELAAARVPTDIATKLLEQIPNYVLGQSSATTSGLGAAAAADRPTRSDQSAWNASNAVQCCFIFIAGSLKESLHPVVRLYRDRSMTARNRRGYCWLADRLVPKMRTNRKTLQLVRLFMTLPMLQYGKYFYGLNRFGIIFAPVTAFWLLAFSALGFKRGPYRRAGSNEIV